MAIAEYMSCDEAEGMSSSAWTTCSSPSTHTDTTISGLCFLNNSTGIHITPGTAVQLTDPGQIIPVGSMDDIRSQPIAPVAHAALQRAQAGIERNLAHLRQGADRAAAQMAGLSRMSVGAVGPQQEIRTFAQQPAAFTHEDLVRASEQIRDSRAQAPSQACESDESYSYRYRIEPEDFPVREPPYQQVPPERWRCYPPDQQVPQHPVCPPQDPQISDSITHSEEYLAHEKKREEAEERAYELLGHMIGEKDLEVYKKTGRLFVKGKKHEYILQKDEGVIQIKKDKVIDLCVHLVRRHTMPLTDNVIALKLMIENGEKEILKLANVCRESDRETYVLPECAGMV